MRSIIVAIARITEQNKDIEEKNEALIKNLVNDCKDYLSNHP
jgi:hypothetical protein